MKNLKILGPGLLFAGAAVGTSHLVQSTRAGAVFGLGLLFVVLLANMVKYPAFRFGAHYAAATGKNLVSGYRALGWFPPVFFGAVLVLADGFAMAAVSLVTAGILKSVFALEAPILMLTAGVMIVAAAFLVFGRFQWLDRINKLFMAILAISTLAATILVLPRIGWSFPLEAGDMPDLAVLMFIAALAGWMPTPIESSVFSSLWTVEKMKTSDGTIDRDALLADFDIGYWATALLAVCFLLLGAGIMYVDGIAPADSAPGFAAQVMGLYGNTLGNWSVPIVGVAAISVMFTTCLAAFDGVTRSLVAVAEELHGPVSDEGKQTAYAASLVGLLTAAFLLLSFFLHSFKAFIDFVTSLAFLTAPVLAWFNHRVMLDGDVPEEDKPAPYLIMWSRLGILVMGLFALGYLFLIFS
ncbi:MAG: divalent metal cation transporter [Alphaproteobacteria bacterium]|nr:divalent metal cation transporter [Alphaproteobacteria bacterium]